MDREQVAAELQTLRALCDESVGHEERQRLLEVLGAGNFRRPEHQVVFESIRALFLRGRFSIAQLRVHLNNRGFPDIDVENYFPAGSAGAHADQTDPLES
jgi:hypothetical protein